MLGLDPASIRLAVHDERGSAARGQAVPGAITLAGDLSDPAADPRGDTALLLHELVHIAQHANASTSSRRPDVTAAEAEAAGIVMAHRSGAPIWMPREVLPSGYAARNGGAKGVVPAGGPPVVSTTDDRQALALVLTMLDTQPDGDQRRGAITMLVGLAMQTGPAQDAASERLIKALKGEPTKNLFDHMTAIEDLKAWIPTHGERAYDYILIARAWFADHSKDEVGSGLSLTLFQKYLHYGRGTLAIAYLKQRLTGGGTLMPNLAARVIADLLELQGTPDAAKFQRNYAALRAMAMANGWQSFGPLAAASSTPMIFAALDGIRQQAVLLSRMVLLAPIGDPWEKEDIAALDALVDGLSAQGVLRSATGSLVFTAENREETEHELLSTNPVSTGQWLLEMSRTFAIALDAGARLQERTQVLHANALALDQVLGAQGRSSDERQALFDVRHGYVTAWVSVAGLVFGGARPDVARGYQADLDAAEWRFEHFDEALAARKFRGAKARYAEYSKFFRDGNDSYPGNDQLDERFFFVLRDALKDEGEDITRRLATGFTGQLGNGMVMNVLPGPDDVPTDLRMVAALDRDVSIFGMQAALFLVYASNLSIHNMMIKADVGSKNFRAEQGKTLSDQRIELQGFCRTGDYVPFMGKVEAYQKTLKDVAGNIKDRAKIDFLISLVITLIAALVTEGAALAVRLASLSELVALARTARAVASFSTLFEVGVFTASQLTLQRMFFGKEITGLDVIKTAATNLVFLGALKAVGAFAEPLTQGGGAVRQLLIGHLVGFSGTAAVSLLLGRIETGQWPPDISTFLAETAITYLLIAGMHHAFTELAAKPILKGAATARLESLTAANEELMVRLRGKVDTATLTRPEFEALRQERIRLLEEARAVAKVLKDGGVISAAELAAIERTADGAVAGATSARFPTPADAIDPVIRALPAPDSVIELTRVGDTNTYVYDPAKPRTKIDEMLVKYQAKGFTVSGTGALTRVVDPQGRTRFLLTSGPVPRTQLLLPAGVGPIADDPPLVRATGARGPALDAVRTSLEKINREAEAKLTAEYDDYAAVSTLSLLVEQASVIKPGWSINSIRGLADALSLQRGIPRSAVRRLFQAVPPAQLPDLFAAYHDIVTSPKVSPGSQFLIADDLLPRRSVSLIEGWRKMKAAGLTLPPDMDLRATRGVDKQMTKQPGGWVDWLANIPVERRGAQLRVVSGLVDPSFTPPTTTTQLLAEMTADLPGHPGLNAVSGATPGDFVKALEKNPAGGFSEPILRALFESKVERMRNDVALLQQGAELAHGNWEGIVGRAKEVRRTAQVLLEGGQIVSADRDVGPKGPIPSVNLADVALPGGGKVTNAPPEKNVHMDLLFTDAAGKLVAMEITTAELGLPDAWVALDPKNPAYGSDIDWSALDKPKPPSSHRKFMQAVKIYQLNKAGVALTAGPPAEMVMSAGDFTARAARALEALGFRLEMGDGTRVTAAQVEARKKGGATGP